MIVRNKTTGQIISNRASKSGARGLMFKKRLNKKEALLLERPYESRLSASVHMFFVFFSIDVIWLDKKKKVVDIAKNLLPFTPFQMPKKKAKYILELQGKTIEDKKIRINDCFEFN